MDERLRRLLHPKAIRLGAVAERQGTSDALVGGGWSRQAADAKADLFSRAARRLIESGHGPESEALALFAPGRVEVLGKHTDYCGGRSLLCTTERGICLIAVPAPQPRLRVLYEGGDHVEIGLADPADPEADERYIPTVVERLAKNFGPLQKGLDLAIAADLPPAAGMSSSSALVTGVCLQLLALQGLADHPAVLENFQTLEDFAEYCGCIENGSAFKTLTGDKGVGTFGGSQDHTAILCSQPGRMVIYRYAPLTHERTLTVPDEFTLAVFQSGVTAKKTGDAMAQYNALSLRVRQILKMWNAETGHGDRYLAHAIARDNGLHLLEQVIERRADLDEKDVLLRHLRQFNTESNQLIPQAADALESRQDELFGQLVDRSQNLTETCLENQIPQTIALCRGGRAAGAVAASAFGAGFGGSVWMLIRKAELDAVLERMKQQDLGVGELQYFVSDAGAPVGFVEM